MKTRPSSVPVVARGAGALDLFQGMNEWTDRIAKRAYELFRQHGSSDGHALDDWLAAEREFLIPVAVEMKEADGEFVVKARVPGLKAKDIHVQVDGSRLAIESKTDSKGDGKAQQVYRIIDLPMPILANGANGQFKNGVLKLKLPKAKKAKGGG